MGEVASGSEVLTVDSSARVEYMKDRAAETKNYCGVEH
nr:hypothetical protein JVH1_2266 [Rhodococcus sp. JVH1]